MKPQKEQPQKRVKNTDKNFKMPNAYKNMLSGIKDPQKRSLWKRSFIDAAVALDNHRKAKYVDIFVNARNFKETTE